MDEILIVHIIFFAHCYTFLLIYIQQQSLLFAFLIFWLRASNIVFLKKARDTCINLLLHFHIPLLVQTHFCDLWACAAPPSYCMCLQLSSVMRQISSLRQILFSFLNVSLYLEVMTQKRSFDKSIRLVDSRV